MISRIRYGEQDRELFNYDNDSDLEWEVCGVSDLRSVFLGFEDEWTKVIVFCWHQCVGFCLP